MKSPWNPYEIPIEIQLKSPCFSNFSARALTIPHRPHLVKAARFRLKLLKVQLVAQDLQLLWAMKNLGIFWEFDRIFQKGVWTWEGFFSMGSESGIDSSCFQGDMMRSGGITWDWL